MRPSASKTPAERSPASRTEVEKAVRTSVCACSSTTAMRRLHMICMWICERAELALFIMVMVEANPRGGGGQHRLPPASAAQCVVKRDLRGGQRRQRHHPLTACRGRWRSNCLSIGNDRDERAFECVY